jgi:hypothetical protein
MSRVELTRYHNEPTRVEPSRVEPARYPALALSRNSLPFLPKYSEEFILKTR